MWIPDWLYERLPLLYLVSGCACLLELGESSVAKLSALLFFASAVLALGMRRSARRPVVARRRPQPMRR